MANVYDFKKTANSRYRYSSQSSDRMCFGEHKELSIGEVMLNYPSYIQWMLAELYPKKRMLEAISKFYKVMDIYDGKPFIEKCSNCKKRATRCGVYYGTIIPHFWCKHCPPSTSGTGSGKIIRMRTYNDAVAYARRQFGHGEHIKELVCAIAHAKSLADSLDKEQVRLFFAKP